MSPVVAVQGVGKYYKRYASKRGRLIEWLTNDRFIKHDRAWVLKDVSFEIEPGSSVGIIGQNGAGKSTLLKILTGTTTPSTGSVSMNGRVAALLELGMGFHGDFTGRDNAVMSGQLLGYSTDEIATLMPEIEAFAEIGDYIDQPVRTYSSGMQVRLAFAVATAVRPDILIVDEALSVGDAYFQHKCFDRIRSFRKAGTTLLFVSHDAGAVKNLCDRAILLDKGAMVKDGPPEEVLDYYNAIIAMREADYAIRQSRDLGGKVQYRSGGAEAEIRSVKIYRGGQESMAVQIEDEVELVVEFIPHRPMPSPTIGILFKDRLGNEVFGTNTSHLGLPPRDLEVGVPCAARFRFPVNLGVGHYSLTVALHAGLTHLEGNYDWWDHALTLQVVPGSGFQFIGSAFLPVQASVGLSSAKPSSFTPSPNAVPE